MNIGGYRPDGNIMTVPEIKEKVDTIQGNVTTLNEAVGELETGLNTLSGKVLLAEELTLQNIILYGYTVSDKRVYTLYSIPKMLNPEKKYRVDLTNVTSMYVRCNGILKGFVGNANVVSEISQVLVRDGHIRFTLKAIDELPTNYPAIHMVEGFLTIREVD